MKKRYVTILSFGITLVVYATFIIPKKVSEQKKEEVSSINKNKILSYKNQSLNNKYHQYPPSKEPYKIEKQETLKPQKESPYFYLGENSPYPNLLKKEVELISINSDGLAQYQYKDQLIITITPDGKVYYLPKEI